VETKEVILSKFVIPTGAKRSGGICILPATDHNYFVYLMASRSRNLYCGVTNGLRRRVIEHKDGTGEGFATSYNCNRLVWFEQFQYVNNAIAREKQIEQWRRDKKLHLIEGANPSWTDLAEGWQNADPSTSLRSGRDDK
jgi:putative endonuclease